MQCLQGIQRQDQPVFNVLCKCSRYNETLVKLLSTIEPGSSVTQETLDQLFLIAQAQGRYLQEEYAALIVNGQFDKRTSKLFLALQKNTSRHNPSSLDTLRSAASLAAVSKPPQASRYGSYSACGRGRGNYGYNASLVSLPMMTINFRRCFAVYTCIYQFMWTLCISQIIVLV